MHAIVRQGHGKYYISAVFGYYCDITGKDDYGKYLQSIYNPYWIVWDVNGERLIRWHDNEPNTKFIVRQTLIVDSSRDNWKLDDNGNGCVDFLSREQLDLLLDSDQQPADILDKCRAMDFGYVYDAIPEIKTQKDIDDLSWASGGFHDAFIEKQELLEDGTLHLLFDGTWGCKVEVWFWGDMEYDTSSRNPEVSDPYWFGATILLHDGFVYLVDGDDMAVEEIGPGQCFFKARHMRYRIIPD